LSRNVLQDPACFWLIYSKITSGFQSFLEFGCRSVEVGKGLLVVWVKHDVTQSLPALQALCVQIVVGLQLSLVLINKPDKLLGDFLNADQCKN